MFKERISRKRQANMKMFPVANRQVLFLGIFIAFLSTSTAVAQEVRYSYLEMAFMSQDADKTGMQTPVAGQTVDYDTSDGAGIRFRGSISVWKDVYLFLNYGSTDIDLSAFIVSPLVPQGQTASDEFDLTTIRGGLGYKYAIGNNTDVFAEVTYDSADLDFGSFALENFDTGEKDFGAALGARRMMNDDLEVRAWARYSSVGDVDLNSLDFDADTLFGIGFGWEVLRGLSIVGDLETGEFANYSLGFRLDLDEN